jgi:hypothetical protein
VKKPYVLTLKDPFGEVVLKAEFDSEYLSDQLIEQWFPLELSDNHALAHIIKVERL